MPSSNGIFHVVNADRLDSERDVFVGLPVECNNKQVFHRIPVGTGTVARVCNRLRVLRSSCTETDNGERQIRVQLFPGSTNVVQSTYGLLHTGTPARVWWRGKKEKHTGGALDADC